LLNHRNKHTFIQSLAKLAGDGYYWSPRRFFRSVWSFLRNIQSERAVLRLLSRRPEYKRLAKTTPRLAVKFLGVDYIARGLTVKQRVGCFLHHYRRLPDGLPPGVLSRVLFKDVTVHEIREGEHWFTIKMGPSRPWDYEGELSLYFDVDGQLVFSLSFTIVPGWVVQSEFDEVVLISRLQGVKGRFAQIQLATRALCDVAPPALLVAALCGIADAYGIRGMAGINARMKPEFYFDVGEAALEQAYDVFFTKIGATRAPSGFYLCPIPLPEKPMTQIKKGHKTRTRERRALKRKVAADVSRWFGLPHPQQELPHSQLNQKQLSWNASEFFHTGSATSAND
jgi:uncharacterized protein